MNDVFGGGFSYNVLVEGPAHTMWFAVREKWPDQPADALGREVARFVNADDAEAYCNWRNTDRDGLYTCPECGHREPTDPGCSNCCRDGQ